LIERAVSFRDPAGRVFLRDDRVLRAVNESGVAIIQSLLASPSASKLVSEGKLIASRLSAERIEGATLVLEHDRVPFISYPHEWPPEMLHAAGALTLEIAAALLPETLGLKDATPFNVLFRGAVPLFVDVLSAETRDPLDPIWIAEAQFERTFVLPLIASLLGIDAASIFLPRRDGIEPEQLLPLIPPMKRWSPRFLTSVTLPAKLAAKGRNKPSIYRSRLVDSREKAQFILGATLRRLSKHLDRWTPAAQASVWSDYETGSSYSRDELEAKETFVRDALRELAPKSVLDAGCNTGVYSRIAAEAGARVVAIDSDRTVAGRVWRMARERQLDILPLVVNLARPTPSAGWRNAEEVSFLDRAAGSFDVVMMLALVHHLVVTERAPLDEIVSLASQLTRDALLIEWVDPQDEMFVTLARGRDHLYAGVDRAAFEQACASSFEIVRSIPTRPHRTLYFMRKRER